MIKITGNFDGVGKNHLKMMKITENFDGIEKNPKIKEWTKS